MTAYPHYLRYLEEAKREEIADQLRFDGYVVEMEKVAGDMRFDLMAQKNDHKLVYEFKAVGSRRISRDIMMRLQQAAKSEGYEFHVLFVNPPPRKNIEIPRLDSELLDYAINQKFPAELDSLSTHTYIENIVDIEVSAIRINGSGAHIEGTGTIEVSLEYGNGSDNSNINDAFPFDFQALLSLSGSLQSVERFTVDTSSFYE